MHQVFLDGIIDNIASLVQSNRYGFVNTADTTTDGFCVIRFISEAYTLQNNIKMDGQIISDGRLVLKATYICSVQ